MEGWRQRRLGANSWNPQEEKSKTDLALIGLPMEGIESTALGDRATL